MIPNWVPWFLYRLLMRIRLWRHSSQWLNRRTEVEGTLRRAAKGEGLTAEQCRATAEKLVGGFNG